MQNLHTGEMRKNMKKLTTIIVILLLILPIAGCGKKSTVICTYEEGFMTAVNTLEAEGDKIVKLTYDNSANLTEGRIDHDTMQASVDNAIDLYSGTDGVSYTYEFEGDFFHETLTFDMKTVSAADLVKMGITSDSKSSGVSLKLTIENMEASGFSCSK